MRAQQVHTLCDDLSGNVSSLNVAKTTSGEPNAVKGAHPVRKGADGKVLRATGVTRGQPTLLFAHFGLCEKIEDIAGCNRKEFQSETYRFG